MIAQLGGCGDVINYGTVNLGQLKAPSRVNLLCISKEKRMTEPLCKKDKFYNHVCQVILFSLYFNKYTVTRA